MLGSLGGHSLRTALCTATPPGRPWWPLLPDGRRNSGARLSSPTTPYMLKTAEARAKLSSPQMTSASTEGLLRPVSTSGTLLTGLLPGLKLGVPSAPLSCRSRGWDGMLRPGIVGPTTVAANAACATTPLRCSGASCMSPPSGMRNAVWLRRLRRSRQGMGTQSIRMCAVPTVALLRGGFSSSRLSTA